MPSGAILLLLACTALVGCNTVDKDSPDSADASVRKLLASPYCDSNAPQRASWVDDEQALRMHWTRLHGHRVEPPLVPALDFAVETVVLLEMGSRPSAGFVLDLATTRLVQDSGDHVVAISWQEPAPGAVVAQVLTSPCLMIAIPSSISGPIEVRDQHGEMRYSLKRKSAPQ